MQPHSASGRVSLASCQGVFQQGPLCAASAAQWLAARSMPCDDDVARTSVLLVLGHRNPYSCGGEGSKQVLPRMAWL
jgi:hypothetical protein